MSNHTIYKYPLGITDKQVVTLPRSSWFLKVGEQYGQLCVWALVDTEEELTTYVFRIYGTGMPVDVDPIRLQHIDSVICQEGALVWHVFIEEVSDE